MAGDEKQKRIAEYRAKRAEEIKEMEARLAEEQARHRRTERAQKIDAGIDRVMRQMPRVIRVACALLIHYEFRKASLALLAFVVLETIAGTYRQH